jgi:hypothetical protein
VFLNAARNREKEKHTHTPAKNKKQRINYIPRRRKLRSVRFSYKTRRRRRKKHTASMVIVGNDHPRVSDIRAGLIEVE